MTKIQNNIFRFAFFLSLAFPFQKSLGNDPKLDSLKRLLLKYRITDPDSAFYTIRKGITLAREKNNSLWLGNFYRYKGLHFQHTSQKLAVKNFFKARQIFEKINHKTGLALAYIHLSNASINFKEQVRMAQKAYKISYEAGDTLIMAHALSALGWSLRDMMPDSALIVYKKALKLAVAIIDSNTIAMIYNNIGTIQNGVDNQMACQSFLNSIRISKDKEHILGSQGNLMQIYLKLNMLDSALYYYELLKPHFKRRPFMEGAYYGAFSEYYAHKGEGLKAYTLLKKADSIKDILAKEEDASALNLMELEYEARTKESEMALLHVEIEKAEHMRYFLISILLLAFAAGSIILYQGKQKARKKREILLHKKRRAEAEKMLMAEKLQHAELRSRHLSNQLKYTSHELAYIATGKVQNLELLSELKKYVEETYRKKDLGSIKDNLRELNIQLIQLINKDRNEQQKIVEKAEDINTSLIYGLKEKFPDLSESDTKLLMLLLLKFNSKEIASMYNIERRSVVVRRYRLRKKLGIKKRETFEDFFARVIPNIELVQESSRLSREQQNGKQH